MSAFLSPSAAEYDVPGLMRSRSFSEAQYEWREKNKVERYEEEYEGPEKDGLRRNLSRRWSQTLRRSWGSRRSYVSGTTDVASEESEGTLKVKRVTRLRDWSYELDDSDILAPKVEAPIVWAETSFDIGVHWRYISEED